MVPHFMPDRCRIPLWLYPNLLSLDAPLVAVLWLWVFAQMWRADYLPIPAYIVLGLAVWAVYIFDRLFDASLRSGAPEMLEERHRFHLKHKRKFMACGILVAVGALLLTLVALPIQIFSYAVFGGVLVLAFFVLSIFSSQKRGEIEYGKNIIAGLAFAYGTALAAHVYVPILDSSGIRFLDLAMTREVIVFGVLCIVNITAIDVWEYSLQSPDIEESASAELSITLPLAVLAAASVIFAYKASRDDGTETIERFYYVAILTASALFYMLGRCRDRFSATQLRVLADVALIIPVGVFAVLHYTS
jgi:hypothetical protein